VQLCPWESGNCVSWCQGWQGDVAMAAANNPFANMRLTWTGSSQRSCLGWDALTQQQAFLRRWYLWAFVLWIHAAQVSAQGPMYFIQKNMGGLSLQRGCHSISSSQTIDVSSSTACDSGPCAGCFRLDTASNAVILTISNCNYDVAGSDLSTDAMRPYIFFNSGENTGTVTDGIRSYVLPAAGLFGCATTCTCFDGRMLCGTFSFETATTVKPQLNYDVSTTCMEVGTTPTPALDISQTSCNGVFCPRCFAIYSTSFDVSLHVDNCQYSEGTDVGSGRLLEYRFYNRGTYLGKFSDGTNKYTLSPYGLGQSSARCICYAGQFMCDVPTVEAHAGKPYGTAYLSEALSVTYQAHIGSALPVRKFS